MKGPKPDGRRNYWRGGGDGGEKYSSTGDTSPVGFNSAPSANGDPESAGSRIATWPRTMDLMSFVQRQLICGPASSLTSVVAGCPW